MLCGTCKRLALCADASAAMLCLVATPHSLMSPCRDGLERVEVDNAATVQQLKQKISNTLNIPAEDIVLSKDSKLVRLPGP